MVAFTDAHLDIAWSSLEKGRDFVLGHPDATLGLPELLAGGVTLACATLFAAQHGEDETAAEVAERQLAYYEALPGRAKGKVVWPADAMDVGLASPGQKVCLIGLMEGCEPLGAPAEMEAFYARGIRVASLTWNKRNRFAAGCKTTGGLTAEGSELVRLMDRLHMVHDLSHLSAETIDDLFALARGPVMASHVGARAVFDHPRNLSDAHLRELAARGGVACLVLYSKLLTDAPRATMDDVLRHLLHMVEVCGPRHVGIGTDLDGGFGREDLPAGIHTAADLKKIAEALTARGVSDEDTARICGGNARRVLTSVM